MILVQQLACASCSEGILEFLQPNGTKSCHLGTKSLIPATETAIGCFCNCKFACKLAVESRFATFCTGIIDQIYEAVWKEPSFSAENTVAVHIRRIREKIEINPKDPKYVKVVWGIGYRMERI
jgi:hypothetical protein